MAAPTPPATPIADALAHIDACAHRLVDELAARGAAPRMGDRVRLRHCPQLVGEVTWIGARTLIVTYELTAGQGWALARLRKDPHTPLVGHPWTHSVEQPHDAVELVDAGADAARLASALDRQADRLARELVRA